MSSPGKPRPPRKPLLDPPKRSGICAILAIGGSRALAARYVGCSLSMIRKEAERDAEFRVALDQAEARHEVRCLQRLHAAADDETNWRVVAWMLERIYPDRYASRNPEQLATPQIIEALESFADLAADHITDRTARLDFYAAFADLVEDLQADAAWLVPARRPDSPRRQE